MRTLAFLVLFGITSAAGADDKKEVKSTSAERVFELRTYTAAPGKMKDLEARFRDHTCKLFEKHGMTIVGFWTPMAVASKAGEEAKPKEEKLIYLLAFPSKDAAAKSWKDFVSDPDWKAAFAASEKNGKLTAKVESVYLNPTDFSPIK